MTTPTSWDPASGHRWSEYLEGAKITTDSIRMGSRYISLPPDNVRASIECGVAPTGNRLYRYTYKITNVGSRPLAAIAVDVQGEIKDFSGRDGQLTQGKYVWNYSKTEGIKQQFYSILWNGKQGGYTSTEYGLPPAGTVELVLESPNPPSGVRMMVRGVGWVIDGVANQIVGAPIDLWLSGPVFGPNKVLDSMDQRGVLNALLADVDIAYREGWVTGNARPALKAMMAGIQACATTTRDESVVNTAMNDLRSGTFSREWADPDFIRCFGISLRYYFDRFCRSEGRK